MKHPRPLRWIRLIPFSFALALSLLAPAAAQASDWPQWRGPHRDGQSPETGLLEAWPEAGPPLAWKTSGLGIGFSSLSATGGRLFTLGDVGDDQLLFALAADGGKLLWKARLGPANPSHFPGARSTPTVAGDRVFALGSDGDLRAFETADGKELWHRSLRQDFGGTLMKAQGTYDWQFAESPLVDGDRVIVTPGSAAAALVALDAASGREIWRTALPALGPAGADGAGYSSVVVSEGAGVRQYVQLLGRGLIGVEAATGRLLWSYNQVANDVANIPTPLIDGDLIFTSSGYGTGAALLRLKKTEDGVAAEEVYFLPGKTFQNHHGGMVLVDGYVYTGHGHNQGLPICLKLATGEIVWGPERTEGKASAAIAYADGHLYLRYQNGLMLLLDASPKGLTSRGSFLIPEVKAESWPHPVIADGHLLLREQDNLYAYDLRPPKEAPKAPAPPAQPAPPAEPAEGTR